MLIDGSAADDLAIFVTGSGTVHATLRADAKPQSVPRPFLPRLLEWISLQIVSTRLTLQPIPWLQRAYTAGADISYQGIRVQFDNVPKSGDQYTVEANTDGLGSNENILRMIDLGRAPLIAGQTFSCRVSRSRSRCGLSRATGRARKRGDAGGSRSGTSESRICSSV